MAEGENVKTENGQTSESSPEEVGTLAKSDLETSNAGWPMVFFPHNC